MADATTSGQPDDATRYAEFDEFTFSRPSEGVLELVMGAEGKLSTAGHDLHRQLAYVWNVIDQDPTVKVAILRGEGKGFSGGGSFDLVEDMANNFDVRIKVLREARDIVYNVINCAKPIVSAMHGPAVGAGLVAGLLADISLAASDARIIDGHTRLGVAAGDHAAICWPLLCGMAKAKYHLMLCEQVTGEEAERMGLVSKAVPKDGLFDEARSVAKRLAEMSPTAIRYTKQTLNNWYRMMGPTFDASLAYEFIGFSGPDVLEGVASHKERRPGNFTGPAPE